MRNNTGDWTKNYGQTTKLKTLILTRPTPLPHSTTPKIWITIHNETKPCSRKTKSWTTSQKHWTKMSFLQIDQVQIEEHLHIPAQLAIFLQGKETQSTDATEKNNKENNDNGRPLISFTCSLRGTALIFFSFFLCLGVFLLLLSVCFENLLES